MTDDTVTPVDMDNLDNFSNTFFNSEAPAPEVEDDVEVENEEVNENEDDSLAPSEDEETEDETEESEDDQDESEEEEEEKPKPRGRKSAKERIEELVAKTREQERREADLLRRLEQLEAAKPQEETKTETANTVRSLPADAPSPDATDKDGKALYPLGEFDPSFIADLTRYTIKVETEAHDKKKAEAARAQEVENIQNELKTSWVEKVAAVEEELPDLREKLADLSGTFKDIDPGYGEYLASTIMTCENGPQIMYYLSQNIGEAQKIVASGPAAATLAIGKLDAKLAAPAQEEKRNKKVSDAPKPPENRNKGRGASNAARPDTNDLKAFEREFFKKK